MTKCSRGRVTPTKNEFDLLSAKHTKLLQRLYTDRMAPSNGPDSPRQAPNTLWPQLSTAASALRRSRYAELLFRRVQRTVSTRSLTQRCRGKKNKKNLLSIVKSPNLQGASWGNTKMPTPAHSLPPRASLDWDRLVTRLQYFLFLLFLTLTRAHPDPGTCHTWSKNQILKPQTWCL